MVTSISLEMNLTVLRRLVSYNSSIVNYMFFIDNQIGTNDSIPEGTSVTGISITDMADLPGDKIILIYIMSTYLFVNKQINQDNKHIYPILVCIT